MRKNRAWFSAIASLGMMFGSLAVLGVSAPKAYAGGCNSGFGRLDPTCPGRILNPGDRVGDAGAAAYQAAAEWMRANNGSSQSLDAIQKQYLRPHFGDLVDRVSVVYNANLMDEWSALGYRINLDESAAQTYCNRIYVDDPYQQGDRNQITLLAHELVHSRQCEGYGGAGSFGWHYFKQFYEAGGSYASNRLEREAFDFEEQFGQEIAQLTSASINYEELTQQLYRQILGRNPDPSGFRDNVNAMRQHGFEWVRAGMAGSQESRNNINNLYRQYLCRNADPGGMDHHINLLASGQMTLDQIRNGIANGAEAQQHKNGCR